MGRPIKIQDLGSADVAWLRMDTPTNPMVVVGLLALGREMSFDELRQLLRERLLVFDRFTQRIDLDGRPRWITDDDFDLDAHVHPADTPSPTSRQDLEVFIGKRMSTPLDMSKPPWEAHFIDSYECGSAVVMTLHHAIGDGIALVQVLLSLSDEHFEQLNLSRLPSYGRPPRHEPRLANIRRSLAEASFAGGRRAVALASGAARLVRRPARILEGLVRGARITSAAGRIAFLPTDSDTRFKSGAGLTKRAAWSAAMPLDALKNIGNGTGAKLNDVIVTAAAGGLRRYLQARGEPVEGVELGSVIPVNLRLDGHAFKLGNEFGVVFLSLPVGIAEPGARLREVQRRMDRQKHSGESIVTKGILKVAGAGPVMLHRKVLDILGSKNSAVITNVPGPRERLHFDGHPISEVMYWVPRAGEIGLGLSIISYNGSVLIGVATDAGMAPDPAAIIDGIREELHAMSNGAL